MPSNEGSFGYRVVIVGGDCEETGNSKQFPAKESPSGITVVAAPEIIIDPAQITTQANTVCTPPAPFDGEININSAVSGGAGGYEYSIDGTTFQTSPIFSGLEHGTYTVTVIDQNSTTVGDNCTKTVSVDVPDGRVPPTVAITPTAPEACAAVDLPLNGNPTGGTGVYVAHLWTGDVGTLSATNVENPTFNSTTPGTYNLTYEVTDDKGCTATSSVTVTVANPTVVSLFVDEVDNTICAGESTSVIIRNAQTGYRYQLRNDADNSPIGGPANGADVDLTLPTGNLAATTTFNVLVSSISGPCPDVELTDQATVTVVDAVDLTLAVSAQTSPLCSGESTNILLESSELNVDYQLRNDADDSNVGSVITGTGGDLSFLTGILATSTTFHIIADNGVCTEAELNNKASVTVNPSPTQAVLSGDATVCAGSTTNLVVTITGGAGPFSFILVNSVDATTIPVTNYTSGDDISVSPTADVTYTINGQVTDANGCEVAGSGSATVTLNQGPTAASISGNATICEGETTNVQLTITGGQAPYAFTLSDGNAITSYSSGDNISVSPASTTSYTVATVQDANGCEVAVGGSADVTVNPRPTPFNVGPSSLALCPGDDATITLNGSQSGVTYEIYRNTAPTGQTVSGNGSSVNLTLSSGSFANNDVLTVQANNGICVTPMTGSSTVTISTISAFGITSPASVTACSGDAVTVSLGGSENGVTYELLKDGAGTGTFVNGTGSAINFGTTVSSGDNGSAFSVIGRRTTCAQAMSGSTTATVSNLTAEAGLPQSTPENTAVVLSGSASNGSGTYTYAWTSSPANQIAPGEETNQNPNTINLTGTTTFTLEVTDTNTGCKSSDVVTITVTGGLPTVAASANPTTVCAGEAVQLTAAASGGDGSYTYAWDNGAGTGASPTVNPLVTTTYEVTATDGNGDTAQDQVTVTVNPLPTAYNLTPSPSALVCSGSDVTVALDGEDTNVTYTLLLNGAEVVGNVPASTGTGLEFTMANGTFNAGDVLTIRAEDDITGCARLMNGSATIQTNDPQPFAVTAVDTEVCTGEDAIIQLSGSESGVDYNVLMNGTLVTTVPGDNNALTITILFADLVDGGSVTVAANNGSCTVAMTGAATVSISSITTADAGPDETICTDGYLFSANAASTTETGTWTVQSGGGTFVSINNPATVVNGLSVGDNVFKWTISDNNGVCNPTEDLVTITRRDVTAADAGVAQTVCADEVILAANNPVAGEQGTWTTTGAGLFDDPNDPATRVTNLDVGANDFVWTISDNSGTCPSTQAAVTVTRNQLTADAGTDASIPTGTTASLSGSAINGTGPYAYRWEPAALLDDPNVANPTTVALTASTNFTLTVTDDGVGSTCQRTDQVTITVTGGPPSVIASAEGSEDPIAICEGETIDLSALGSGGDGAYTYAWTSDNLTVITQADPNDPQATASPTLTTTFTVEITDGNGDQATDDIVVAVNALPIAFTIGTDPTLVCSSTDASISLDGSETGTQYQLLRNNTVVTALAPVAGDGNALIITLPQSEFSDGDVWTIRAESAAGCRRMMAGQARIQINDPVVYTITTPPVLDVCPGQPATITLDNSDLGFDYVLMTGGNPAATLTGNGASLDFVLPDGSFSDNDVFTIVANNSSCEVAMTGSVEINLVGVDATFSYASGTYCFDGADPMPETGFATGGTFSTTDPITVDPADGTIDVSASTVGGPYTITYTIGSGPCVSTESFQVTIINSTPDPTFSYDQPQYCTQTGTTPPVFTPGATAGTFSYQPVPAGPNTLALASDGTIDLATSDPGTYRVANFITGSGGSCAAATHEETVQIFAPDVADVSYNGGNAICQSETTDPTPAFAAGSTTTGSFTVTSANAADMTIVTATGRIDLSDTDPGSYDIQFVTDGPCPDAITVTVEIEAATDASFTYPASSFCKGTGSVLPNSITTGGGVFSTSAPELLVDSSTGEIDVDGSDAGSYFVIYEPASAGCNGRDSVAITINDITAAAGADDLACRLRYDLVGNTPATGATGAWTVVSTPSGSETATFSNFNAPNSRVNVSDPGSYEFEWTVTQGGCSVSDVVAIEFYYAIEVVSPNYLGTGDCSADDGYKVFAAGGGSGDFTFVWSAGNVGPGGFTFVDGQVYDSSLPPAAGEIQYRNSLPAGIHTLVITDNNIGCDTTVTFAIGVQKFDDLLLVSTSNACGTGNNGEITAERSSDPAADQYQYAITYLDENGDPLSPPVSATYDATTAPNVVVSGFPVGSYFLDIEVTDSPDPTDVGCHFYKEALVEEFTPVEVSLDNVIQPSCAGTTDGSLSITVSGATPNIYAWQDSGGNPVGGNSPGLTNIPAGEYSVDITYNGGTCSQTFGPYSVLPQNTSDGPTAITPLAPSVQCSSFDARWSDEGAGISYRLDVSEDASFTTPLFLEDQAIATNVTTFTVSGLAPGTPYFYRVRSVEGGTGCVSENSNVISVTTETSDVPSGLYVTGASCDEFTANWAPVPGATDYTVQVATDAAFTNVLLAYDAVAVGSNDNKLRITGLTGGQTYHYRVSVATSCGTSAYSASANVTTDGLNDAPTNLSATAGCSTATLSWQAVTGSVSRYEVFLDDDNDFTNGTLSATADATEVTATTTTVSGLTDGTPYFFHVLAILNGCNTTQAVSDVFTTRSEPTPPVVSAPVIRCDGFTLSWAAVPDADDYVIDISEDGFATFTTNTITDLSLDVSSLTPGTLYEYRVKARGCVESAFTGGTVTTDDTPGGLASAPTAAAPSCVGFTVNWTAQPGIRYFVEASPVGDNFTSVIERSAEVDADTYTFATLAVETDYNYRVITVNDCGEGIATNGSGTITTKLAEECGCGHDQVAFTVTTSNATCPGSADGAFTILSRKKSGVTVTPDMGRFKYRYQSLTNPADTSAWEAGEPGSPPLPHFFNSVKAGDYQVLVWDTLGLPGCVDTVAFTTTISLQNQITVVTKAETCDTPGGLVVTIPAACSDPDRIYVGQAIGSTDTYPIDSISNNKLYFSGLIADDYQIVVSDFILTDIIYATLPATIPNNCSSGADTTTVCNLNGITFLPETTLAACDTGEGSVTFTAINDNTETFTFTVIEEGGVVFETKEGSSGITFDNLPSRRYTYEIYDALSQSCRGKFTVGTKSVNFTATVPQAITCDDVTTPINVTVDLDATLAAGPYKVFLIDQTDTLAQASLPLGATTTTFDDVAVGGSYEVVIVAAAEDACVARRTVDATPPGTTALQFTYALDSTACFQTRGGGKITVQNIVVADNTPFDAYLYRVDTGEEVEYASRKFSTTPQSFVFEDIANGQYQVHLVQAQSGCVNTVQEKRSATFTIDGPESELAASIRSYVEVTVNYPYGTIEIDSIVGGGAPYEVRIAADPSGASTEWVEVINENPIVRQYRYEYLDQAVGTYFIELRDRFGCVVRKQVEVGYTAELYIPNIFTPNSDGENDTFQILNLEDFGENAGVQLTITNRWGRQVYRAKNYTNAEAWDGGNLSDGVYFYHLILPDNTIHNGWVEIWRGRTP
ncbi:MAG: fibronectin type III domain-containing protein [Tunicatimonas sp.]